MISDGATEDMTPEPPAASEQCAEEHHIYLSLRHTADGQLAIADAVHARSELLNISEQAAQTYAQQLLEDVSVAVDARGRKGEVTIITERYHYYQVAERERDRYRTQAYNLYAAGQRLWQIVSDTYDGTPTDGNVMMAALDEWEALKKK